MDNSNIGDCLNCHTSTPPDSNYCPNCGQKKQGIKWSFWALISTFFVNLFNIDAKLYLTLRDIWYPGKLTKSFISGKRKPYYHPMRLLLVSLFSFIAILIYFVDFGSLDDFDLEIEQTKSNLLMVHQLDSLKTYMDSSQHHHIDTFIAQQNISIDSVNLMSGLIKLGLGEAKTGELLLKTPEQVIEEEQIEGWFEKMWIHQLYTFFKDPKGMLAYVLSNMTWSVLLLILFMSLIAKILYIRSGRYYVEHFLLYSQVTSFSAFVGILLLGIRALSGFPFSVFFALWILFTLIYAFLSIHFYYQDSIIKTIIKMMILVLLMMILSIFILILISMLAFLVY